MKPWQGRLFMSAAIVSCLFSPAVAQSVSESWLEQAGVVCGAGINVEVHGSIQAALAQKLRFMSGDAEGVYRQSDVETLLGQMAQSEKSSTYRTYVQCLLSVMNMATDNSGLPPRNVMLDAPDEPPSLALVERGNQFEMKVGESRAIGDLSRVFSLQKVHEGGYLDYDWSNSQTGNGNRNQVRQGQVIDLGDECRLVPFAVDTEGRSAAFISNC